MAQLKKSVVLAEVNKGGSVKAIAERIGITTALLKKAAKTFEINLRTKPRTEPVEFVNDVVEEVTEADDCKESCGEAYERASLQDQEVEHTTITMLE